MIKNRISSLFNIFLKAGKGREGDRQTGVAHSPLPDNDNNTGKITFEEKDEVPSSFPLQNEAAPFQGEEPETLHDPGEVRNPIDLFTLCSELVALKNEVKLESRHVKKTLDQFQPLHEMLAASHEALKEEKKKTREQAGLARDLALMSIIGDILEVRDRIEDGIRALRSRKNPSWWERFTRGNSQPLVDSIVEGQEMVLQRMDRMLASHGVLPIETQGRLLDPHLMRAVDLANEEGIEDGMILDEIRKGFFVKNEVFRVAEVKVNKQAVP